MHKWPLMPLSEILTERQETPLAEDLISGRVRIVEKIGFDRGSIHLRSNGTTRTGMIVVHPGDLLVSGINAAKGAIAIYDPNATDPVAATIHYSAYITNANRAYAKYMWWMLRSRFFRSLLSERLPGGIKTELTPKRLLAVPIPLPPLEDQERILVLIEEIATLLATAIKLGQECVRESGGLSSALLQQLVTAKEVSGILGDVLIEPPRNGWSARCDNGPDGVAVLSLSAITGFRYRPAEFKRTSLYADPDAAYWLKRGDLLITRSNTLELVGHAAIYDGNPSPCIYPDLMMRLVPNVTCVIPKFIWYWLQSPIVRDYIMSRAKGTSPSMKKISQATVMHIPFPTMLKKEEQQNIVLKLDALQPDLDRLRTLQGHTATELGSLLPAILDQAFKGEL